METCSIAMPSGDLSRASEPASYVRSAQIPVEVIPLLEERSASALPTFVVVSAPSIAVVQGGGGSGGRAARGRRGSRGGLAHMDLSDDEAMDDVRLGQGTHGGTLKRSCCAHVVCGQVWVCTAYCCR